MLKSFKTEISPTSEQKTKINKTIGTCRFVYNFYLSHNKTLFDNGKTFMTGRAFSVWLNHEFIPNNPEKGWIKDVSSKSVKKSIENGHTAFKRFFNGVSGFPKFKRKGKSDVKMYFVKNNASDCLCERHRIKIPTLGWVRLKEKGYIPVSKDGYHVRSGTVSSKAGRYFVSVLIEMPDIISNNSKSPGIGIDLGIKDLAVLSNGRVYMNINKTGKMRRLEKKLKREQRSLSRMYENKKKGGTSNGIELRIADRFYPSSKRCHHCGYVKKDLKLSERTYHCDACGYTNDRDVNASLNLRDAKEYKTA